MNIEMHHGEASGSGCRRGFQGRSPASGHRGHRHQSESLSLIATNLNKIKGEDGIPFMSPDICIANFYTSTGRLGLHHDKGESKKSIRKGLPVVSFSIGDSAEFLYGDQRDTDKAEMVVLESGDVLLFGGKSRNVFHGVRSILKDTAPKLLLQQTSLRPSRLNLTFRQY